ncbi:pyridoxamine 5'-phosphate oxidase family protein [Paenibacillus sp. KS-LC4]|uniref:pyridoxamine 5'-phosphate oxidase family protein n=1 Tax=Paenibacillus sp. KS-LC4 TaxID=2979727 RepID=UPI0030CDF267
MRRKEFAIGSEDEQEVTAFLEEMSYGFLGTARADSAPSITPLNYIYLNGNIYFHGSRVGDKMALLGADPRVTFCVAKEYAIIPSHFTDPLMACPATAFFKSVIIEGTASVVEDLMEKGEALQALMNKLQPEGGHLPIAGDDPAYRGRLKGVAVVKIVPQQMNAKFKFGQNADEHKREAITTGLLARERELDAETVDLMRRYCPHHKEQAHPGD